MNKEQILAAIKAAMAKQQQIFDTATKENRGFTDAEKTSFNDIQKEIDGHKAQLEAIEQLEANNSFMNAPATPKVVPTTMETQDEVLDDGGFKNLGEFMFCVKNGDKKGRIVALSTSDVGIMIPPKFGQNILMLDGEQEIVMPRATNIPAGDPPDSPFTIPYLSQGADGALGGMALTWTAEGKTISDVKEPNIKDLTLTPQEVSGLATINNKTLANWAAAGTLVETMMRQAYVNGRDSKFIKGSGAGCPLGVLKAPGAIKIKRNTSTTFKYVDAVAMMARFYDLSSAVWIINQNLMPDVMTMKDEANQYIFIAGDATKGTPPTLLGIPIKWTFKNSAKGSEGDVALINFSYYLTKAGSGPFVAISEHVNFKSNQTVFKIVANIDGQPWVKDPLAMEDGTTVSPYVILQ